jgi:hypothetical protein
LALAAQQTVAAAMQEQTQFLTRLHQTAAVVVVQVLRKTVEMVVQAAQQVMQLLAA